MVSRKTLIYNTILFVAITILFIITASTTVFIFSPGRSLSGTAPVSSDINSFDWKTCTNVFNPGGDTNIITIDYSSSFLEAFPPNYREGPTFGTQRIVSLKIYDSLGRMTGINFENNSDKYQEDIPETNYSGNIGTEQWIAYPDRMDICAAIDITLVKRWAEENKKVLPETIIVKMYMMQWRSTDDPGFDGRLRAESVPVDVVVKTKDTITVVHPSILLPLIEPTPYPGFVIFGPPHVKVEATSSTIEWTTNKESDSVVEYWIPGKKDIFSKSDVILTRNHLIKIENLTPNTEYLFRIRSTDSQGNLYQLPEQSSDRGRNFNEGGYSTYTRSN